MSFQKREPSIDMASIELRSSPAPTYTSTCRAEDWPLTPQRTSFTPKAHSSTSNNPYYQSATEGALPSHIRESKRDQKNKDDGEDSPVKADHHDRNHPHYAEHSTKPYTIQTPPLPRRNRWPRKRLLVPWVLAAVFFVTTLWSVSITLGARYFSILQPVQPALSSQEINVFIDGEALRGAILRPTAVPNTPTPISSTIGATSIASSDATLSATGRFNLVPTGQPSLEDIDGRLERMLSGFVTVTKRTA
ncbi:hypothetical protein FB567DRAFT_299573 [Paraphoma chrysanthemicola]|uniref:Uncharacterized protein n=1 Tax=Paraphoma chrysanthemicola TaxID=798071 RepID=A0A8K0RDR6_9PLEO|nr:hypothetical protein FB567DRAFT_299573 [Paraphoma chrysanthemicola]